eukprot:13071625-Heterocapsa_arctica.AAC.1
MRLTPKPSSNANWFSGISDKGTASDCPPTDSSPSQRQRLNPRQSGTRVPPFEPSWGQARGN